ncbi:MAG: WYL domain-containing protein [Coriobacteriia bacterium]|nr:WYL domain-containing protein [Coriobacteriia bacterium]
MGRIPSSLRARRMLALIPYLRRGATVRISDLAATLGTTAEEVTDLLGDLVMCGVPPFSPDALIDLDVQADSVTVLADPPALDRPLRLTHAELRALLAAMETAGICADDPLARKLADAAESASLEHLARSLSAHPDVGAAEIYSLLADAIESSCKVRIAYLSAGETEPRSRVVRPLELVNRNGVWYLVAFCESANGERTFRLDRIRNAEELDERFSRPADPSRSVVPELAGVPTAVLRVAPGYSIDNRDWPGAEVEPQQDGSLRVRLPFASPHWVAREVCSALGAIEVLEPDELRAEVREMAQRLLSELPS